MDLQNRIKDKPHVTRADIEDGLRRLGVRRGDRIMVHSSLSAFGYVEPTETPDDAAVMQAMAPDADGETLDRLAHKVRGANTVIAALRAVVGETGIVMMPSFNHGSVDVYDPLTTPSSSGIITEVFWRTRGVKRSLHPTHPFAAVGSDAETLLAGHVEANTYGKDTPLGRLALGGGYMVVLGVGVRSCTAMHVGESIAGAKCLGYGEGLGKVLRDGRIVHVPTDVWRARGKCPVEGPLLEERLRGPDMIGETPVGEATIGRILGMDLLNTVVQLCQENCLDRCPIWPDYARETRKLRDEILALHKQGRL